MLLGLSNPISYIFDRVELTPLFCLTDLNNEYVSTEIAFSKKRDICGPDGSDALVESLFK